MRGYYSEQQTEQILVTKTYSKVNRRKRIELLVIISCIFIIGYLWVWLLAIWWLISFRRADEDFISLWQRFPQFEGEFPYTKENFSLITSDWQYYHLIKRKNSIKIALMFVLAVPLYGYVLLFLAVILTFGVIGIFLYTQMRKPEKYLAAHTIRHFPSPDYPKDETGTFCGRCGKRLPQRARFCDSCAYPVEIPKKEEGAFKRVSFRQAVELLDSESYPRGTRLDIEFECVVTQAASPEKSGGPAPYRTIRVTDPGKVTTRTLYVWGDLGHRYNIELVAALNPGDRLLVIGPRRPKDSPYYKDENQRDMFWIERWDGTVSGTGTRLLKLEDISSMKVETEVSSPKKPTDLIEFTPEAPVAKPQTLTPPFYCQLCSIKHAAGTPRMQCDACGRFVCIEAFADMAQVGRTNCPMCDGKLSSV